MSLTIPELFVIGVPIVLSLVWLVNLAGRVNTHDVLMNALRDDITYIRGRIDEAVKPKT